MRWLNRIAQGSKDYLETLRLRLATQQAELQLALLGAMSGVIAALSMIIFRIVIQFSPAFLIGAGNAEDFEHLGPWTRLLLPIAGGLLVGLLFHRLNFANRQVGVVHVLERLAYSEGHLPIKNAGVQFMGAVLCIIFGQSVGREGPSIHIGAASGSWIGQRLRLPNNSIRVLVGCGTAGAIAAAFNTPLAGVIFAMEVVMAEYNLASFIPIILAAVSATTVSLWVLGPTPLFVAPEFGLGSLGNLIYITLMGIMLGGLSSLFVRLLVFFSSCLNNRPVWLRMTLAGGFTGLLALVAPQIMGIGYDTVNEVLLNNLSLGLMLGLLICKLLATAVALGLGLPGGVIGPTLVMGAVAGGAIGFLLDLYAPGPILPSFYAMLGMGAMMGATLNAPLAALTALLEFTNDPYIILPGMLAIVAATLTSQQGFGTPSVFIRLMRVRGLVYRSDPISQFLRRLGVISSMDRKVTQLSQHSLDRQQLTELLSSTPGTWLLIRDPQYRAKVLFTADLIRYLETAPKEEQSLDLYELPVQRFDAAPISAQATLLGALRRMDKEQVDALYVVPPYGGRILGVITRKDIERSYQYQSI